MTVLFQTNSLGLSYQPGSEKYSIMTHFPEKMNCVQHSEPGEYFFFEHFKHICYLLYAKFVTKLQIKSISLLLKTKYFCVLIL
jgi:hypothetical protein